MTRALCLLVVVALSGCGYTDSGPDPSPDPDESAVETAQARPVRIHEVVGRSDTVTHRFVGRVEALQTVDLSFEVPGPLERLVPREGASVAAGTLIAALDPLTYELAEREARVELALARQDLDRKRSLLARDGISQSVVDEAQALFDLREVRLAQATENLADTEMYAPFDAYVATRFLDPGVNLRAGTPVVRLLDRSRLLIVANVREGLLATSSPDRVRSMHAAFAFAPDRTFELAYHENRGEADEVAQTYEISFVMEPPEDLTLLPGMTATVVVDLRAPEGDGLLGIPASALVAESERDRGFFVWRYDPASGRVTPQTVEVGTLTGPSVLVSAGLAPGDRIVSSGASQLQAGMRVRPLAPQ